ncbi:response regulator [Tropicimonas sediminicola]|uniref:Response regulator receiver domain-containing protein n=1 Tax=Tropicimonas sediminicola TaxID=1031541 RepID=A0A239F217_9RHOB|nr:response regulator [Tropicimonas sediminicola]SNS50192.1 Response regulator receiver domain-containing protein [Tropicimonas sediminicola]
MTDDLSIQIPSRKPSVDRPLQGLTVLVVEDSRFASEAMRLLCLCSGARIRRADCLASAHRHLAVYRPSAVIVDLGLPDGSGATLIREIAQSDQPVPVLLGTSGDDAAEGVAIAAGAHGFLQKPITSLAVFQQAILSNYPGTIAPNCMRLVSADRVTPDPLALRDDLSHVAEILASPMTRQKLDYVRQFLCSVAFSASDDKLARAANRLAWASQPDPNARAALAEVTSLVEMRMTGTGAF